MPTPARRTRRGRWGVLLASAAFHALLVLMFILDLGRGPVATPARAIDVWLEEAPPPTPKPARALGRASAAPALAGPRAVPSPPSDAVADEVPQPRPDGDASVPPGRPPLTGLTGCPSAGLDRLPPEIRARCLERLAGLGDKPVPRLNFDPSGRYARDATPYLARPPKNGCKPVAAVKDEPTGRTSATIGIGCAWSF